MLTKEQHDEMRALEEALSKFAWNNNIGSNGERLISGICFALRRGYYIHDDFTTIIRNLEEYHNSSNRYISGLYRDRMERTRQEERTRHVLRRISIQNSELME